MIDSLRPLPRANEPSNAVSDATSAPDSSSDSSDSYNGDEARHFLREWRAAQDRYSEATRENGQLEIRLGVSQAGLHAAEEEASLLGRGWPSPTLWWRVRWISVPLSLS